MTEPIYACLWFDGKALEAAKFYCAVFRNSKITLETPMVVNFELNGTKFMGLNGGPNFKFNEAVSFVVNCENQEEIDYYWTALTADGGSESMCGWLKDKYGVSWQIVPANIGKLLMGDPEKSGKAMQALLQMRKLVIADLEKAYNR